MNGTEFLTELLTDAILTVLAVALSAGAAVLGRWLARWKARIFSSEEAASVARTCVLAVEQIYGAGKGEEKLEAALDFAEEILKEKGIRVSREQMTVLAEAALAELTHAFRKEGEHAMD